jgi:uncharacterized repeat protein (TIGR04076 family)
MIFNKVKCEAVNVNTDTGFCPGLAKTEKGEVFIIGPRTPDSKGICCQAFSAMASMKLLFQYTDRLDWENKDYFEIVCPHGFVTYRLSRIKES